MSRKNNKATRKNHHKAQLEREKEAQKKKQRKQKNAERTKTDLEKIHVASTPEVSVKTPGDAMDDAKPATDATALDASKDVRARDTSAVMDDSMDGTKTDDVTATEKATRRKSSTTVKTTRKMFRRDLGRSVIKTALKKKSVPMRMDDDIVMTDAKLPKMAHNVDLFEPKHIKMIRKRVEKRLRKNVMHVRRGSKKKEISFPDM